MILSVFGFQCRDGLWGRAHSLFRRWAAIFAGAAFSYAILDTLFTWSCDCLVTDWPRLHLTSYLDDPSLSYREKNHTVVSVEESATSDLMGWLEGGLDVKQGW